MTTAVLIGTPDPQPHTNLPSPKSCTCIFTGQVGGFFGTRMEVHKVGDPDCHRHRVAGPPIREHGQTTARKLRDKLTDLEERFAVTVSARHKFA